MFGKYYMLILCAFNAQAPQRCRLNTRVDFAEPMPIVIKNGRILEPTDKNGNIDIQYGEDLTISCEGTGYISHPNSIRPLTTAAITCQGGDLFKNDGWLNAPSRFYFFRCSYPPNHESQRTSSTCYDGNPIYQVGYKVDANFYPVYETCFNEASYHPIYSKYTQKNYNHNFQQRVERPFFIADDVYGHVPVDSLFSPRGQKAAVAQLVGSVVEGYFTKQELLSRGHLAAKTDFAFALTERATFHYVNCAPQWTGFNGGNWNTLEVDLRQHVNQADLDTIIYTGTYGVTHLLSGTERQIELYLYADENNNPIIPVPMYFYKVVYEPIRKSGVVFVGINNPHYSIDEARSLVFCDDVCRSGRYGWLTWHPNNISEGYSFCCSVDDFRRTVNHLPPFTVNSLFA